MPSFLNSVFALAGLVRPYNKYLPWVLRHHPLQDWTEEGLLGLVTEVLTGNAEAIRRALQRLTAVARVFADTHHRPEIVAAIDEWDDADHGPVLGLTA